MERDIKRDMERDAVTAVDTERGMDMEALDMAAADTDMVALGTAVVDSEKDMDMAAVDMDMAAVDTAVAITENHSRHYVLSRVTKVTVITKSGVIFFITELENIFFSNFGGFNLTVSHNSKIS